MRTSEQINEIASALAKAQGEIQNVVKDAKNPHFKSDYATLDAVTDTVRPVFAKHGLAIVQMPTSENGIATVDTLITHSSGQWILGGTSCPLSKADAQGLGSATTYLRRYATSAAANIAQTDDDGNAAAQQHAQAKARADVPTVPAGYDDWWLDITATADNGEQALREAWSKSKPPFRAFTTSQRNDKWEALKAKAAKVAPREAVSA
jgi:hypothetical protein